MPAELWPGNWRASASRPPRTSNPFNHSPTRPNSFLNSPLLHRMAARAVRSNAPRFFRNGPQRWSPGFSRPPLVNAPRFFRNGPQRWSPGFSRPPLVNAPRFFRNGPQRWSPGFSRPPLVNAPRFFRNGPRCWSPGFSRPPLINAPRIFRNSRRIRLDFRPYPLRSSPLLHPWGLSAMRRSARAAAWPANWVRYFSMALLLASIAFLAAACCFRRTS